MPDPAHGTSGPSRYDLGWLGGDVGRGNHLMVCTSVSFYLVFISLFAAFSSSSSSASSSSFFLSFSCG